jgi:LysM repeat protein
MKAFATSVCLFFLTAVICASARAQTADPSSAAQPQTAQLEALTKKIDEQNMKIDALSQQLLKIEQQLNKPGVIIGESTPSPAASPGATTDSARASANSHTVAPRETLTSIAKMHKVGVEELQKYNHIEDARKLQPGQVIQIPVSGATAAPSASPTASPSPNE